jgi:hypothetical protein
MIVHGATHRNDVVIIVILNEVCHLVPHDVCIVLVEHQLFESYKEGILRSETKLIWRKFTFGKHNVDVKLTSFDTMGIGRQTWRAQCRYGTNDYAASFLLIHSIIERRECRSGITATGLCSHLIKREEADVEDEAAACATDGWRRVGGDGCDALISFNAASFARCLGLCSKSSLQKQCLLLRKIRKGGGNCGRLEQT